MTIRTEIVRTQQWAITGSTHTFSLREGFQTHSDANSLDAPDYLPTGSTRENVVINTHFQVRAVIGGIAQRS